jgi:hypothetical protein
MIRLYTKSIFLLALTTAVLCNANAQKYWLGNVNSNWNNASNWQPAGVPGASDDVVFSPVVSNASCNLPLSATVNNLTVLSGYTGTITGLNSSYAILTVNQVYLQQGGAVDLRKSRFKSMQNFILEGGTFNKGPSGTVTFSGYLQSGGNCSFLGSKVVTTGNMAVTNGSLDFGSGLVEIYGIFVQSGGQVSKPSGNIHFRNAIAPALQGGSQNWYASTLVANGFVVSNADLVSANATLNFNGTVTIQGSQVALSAGSVLIPPQFGVSINQSELNLGNTVFTCGQFNAIESTLNLGSGNLVLSGDALFNLCVVSKLAGELRFSHDGLVSVTASNFSSGGSLFSCNNLNVDDSFLSLSNSDVLISGNLNLLNASTIEKSQGMLICGNNSLVNLDASSLDLTGCDSIQLGAVATSSSICSFGSSSAVINGNLTINNGSVFSAPSTQLTITGNVELTDATFNHNGGEIIFNPGNSSVRSISGALQFFNTTFLNATGNNVIQFDISGNTLVSNNLKFDNGSSQLRSISLVNGSIELTGDLDINSYRSALISTGNGKIVFTGNSNQTILGTAASQGLAILPHIQLEKSAGVLELSGILSLGNGFSQTSGLIAIDTAAQIYLYGGVFNLSGIGLPQLFVAGSVSLSSSIRVVNQLSIETTGVLNNSESVAILVDGELTNAGIYRNNNANLSVIGALQNAGTFETNSGNVTITGYLNQVDGAFTCGSGSVSLGSDAFISGGRFNASNATVSINGAINQSGGEVWGCLDGKSLTVLGDYLQTSGTYKEQSGTLKIGGQLGIQDRFERSSGLVNFNGNAPQTIPALAYHRISVSGPAREIILSPGTMRISSLINGLSFPTNCTYVKTGNTILFDGNGNQEISGFAYENLSMARGGIKSLVAHSSVANTLQVGPSTEFNADGTDNARIFTLLSTQNQTARIAPLVNGAFISGNVVVQRYTRGGLRSNRFIGSPVDTIGGVKIKQLKDDVLLYGPGGVSNGFNAASVFTANNWVYDEPMANGTEWRSTLSVNETLPTGKGLLLYHCGKPNQAPINPSTIPSAAVIDFSGVPNQGTIALPIQCTGACFEADNGNGWNLLANPYASPIDWMSSDWMRSGVSGTIYIWNPAMNQYASFNLNNPAAATNGGSRYIGPSQGFFLKATSNNPVLTINERVKSDQFADSSLFRLAAPENQLRLKVQNSDNTAGDEVLIQFDANATEQFEEQFDALKPLFPGVELSLSARNNNGDKFAAHVFNSPDLAASDKLIPIEFTGSEGVYTLLPQQIASFDSGLQFILEDAFTGLKTILNDGRAVAVEVNSEIQSKSPNRFMLRITAKKVNSNTSHISIYPNPAISGKVNVYTGSNLNGSLRVYSICGTLLQEQRVYGAENGIQQFDTDQLPSGIYSIVWNDGVINLTAKLVKQ